MYKLLYIQGVNVELTRTANPRLILLMVFVKTNLKRSSLILLKLNSIYNKRFVDRFLTQSYLV